MHARIELNAAPLRKPLYLNIRSTWSTEIFLIGAVAFQCFARVRASEWHPEIRTWRD